jgi:hypothetical protein
MVTTMTRVRPLLAVAIAVLLLSPSVASAQRRRFEVPDLRNTPYLGLGYVASIPDAFVGIAAMGLTPKILGGAGLYADVKFSPTSPGNDPEYDPTITVNQAAVVFADRFYTEKSSWMVVDVALVYAVTKELAVYGGAGYAREHHYQQYFDATQTRGFEGFYWVADPVNSGNHVNALGGLLLRAGRYVLFQMGVGAQPRGPDVGVMFSVPLN